MTPRDIFVSVLVAAFVWPVGTRLGGWIVQNTEAFLGAFALRFLLQRAHGATSAELNAHAMRMSMFVTGGARPLGMPMCAPRCGICTHLGCFDPGPFVGAIPVVAPMPPPPPPPPKEWDRPGDGGAP